MTTASYDPLNIVGTTIADKYRIIGVAGDGGFSIVYKAEHLIWQQPVAIKFFNVLEDADSSLRERLLNDFVQEGKLMSELSSKSAAIVQARDIGKLARGGDEWIPFMVLEWLEGTTLSSLLEQERMIGQTTRNLAEAMMLLEPCAIALDVAHTAAIAHRDLKPANIMVMAAGPDGRPEVKLLDFGIAKTMAKHEQLAEQLELTGRLITAFTPNYGAPEQFSRTHGATGPWTDVYAMALILLEMLHGERVLQGETFYELGTASCDLATRPTPSILNLPVTPQVDAVFAKALEVTPSLRYSTIGAFWRDLHAVMFPGAPPWRAAQPSVPTATAVPITAGGMASTPIQQGRRNNAAIAVGVLCACLVMGGSVGVYFALGPDDSSEVATDTQERPAPSASASALLPWDGPCPKGMKAVNGGSFEMGSNEPGFPLWKPAHQVTVDTYCLDVHEVTVAQYRACVERDQCKPADAEVSFPKDASSSDEDHARQLKAFSKFCNWETAGRDNHPINCVDWYRAEAYCDHLGVRLPTEAEWELAARGTDGRKFPWGNDSGDHTYMNAAGTEWRSWLSDNGLPEPNGLMYEADDGFRGTSPVGRFPRAQTQAGQMDMVGNVWEWTADWYALYKPDAQTNPKGPATGDRKAIRGGGFNGEFSLWVNPAARFHQLATASVHAVGFRCGSDVKSND